jgi:molybdopterin-guanine dinucleotide biosynthesis protein A
MSGDPRPDTLPPLVGGILVGGASRRMAAPKALLQLQGETFLERIARVLGSVVPELLLFGSGAGLPPALAGFAVVPDDPRARGPLAGLLAAFEERPGAAWLMLSCDQPLLSTAALAWLAAGRRHDRIAVLPRLDPLRVDPFPGIFEPACREALSVLASATERGPGEADRRTGSLQPLVRIPGVHVAPVPPALAAEFLGANTPSELALLRSRAALLGARDGGGGEPGGRRRG